MVNIVKALSIFWILNMNLKKISFIDFCIIVLYEIFIKLRSTFRPLKTISIINSLSVSVNESNFALVFFKAACQANPGVEKILHGLIDEFLNTSF